MSGAGTTSPSMASRTPRAWPGPYLVRHACPAALRGRLVRSVREAAAEEPARARYPVRAIAAVAFAFACGLSAALVARAPGAGLDELQGREVLSGHVRSLLGDHLTDIMTTDNDEVAQWFRGRLDFAPRLGDAAAPGFTLVGARVDYVDDRAVAAVVYRQGTHFVNVFSCPMQGARDAGRRLVAGRGLHALGLDRQGLRYWVVGDVPVESLERLAAVLGRG